MYLDLGCCTLQITENSEAKQAENILNNANRNVLKIRKIYLITKRNFPNKKKRKVMP